MFRHFTQLDVGILNICSLIQTDAIPYFPPFTRITCVVLSVIPAPDTINVSW